MAPGAGRSRQRDGPNRMHRTLFGSVWICSLHVCSPVLTTQRKGSTTGPRSSSDNRKYFKIKKNDYKMFIIAPSAIYYKLHRQRGWRYQRSTSKTNPNKNIRQKKKKKTRHDFFLFISNTIFMVRRVCFVTRGARGGGSAPDPTCEHNQNGMVLSKEQQKRKCRSSKR